MVRCPRPGFYHREALRPGSGSHQEASLSRAGQFTAKILNDASTTGPVMKVQTMEGLMTAAIIRRRLMLPFEWLPWIWDSAEGSADAPVDSQEQATKVLDQLMQKYNRLVDAFESGAFTPALGNDEQEGVQRWCHGFLDAAKFNSPAWSFLMVAHPVWFAPFVRLGTFDLSVQRLHL